jgi:hypothetical protein
VKAAGVAAKRAAVANSAVFAALAREASLTVTRAPLVGEIPLTPAIPTW